MKKYISILAILLAFSNLSLAQIERKPAVQQQPNSDPSMVTDKKDKDSRKELFKQLNLTKEQKLKLKEITQGMKASKDAIENDASLSESAKKSKLRSLKKEQAQQIQAILTDEQKAKFRELKAQADNG